MDLFSSEKDKPEEKKESKEESEKEIKEENIEGTVFALPTMSDDAKTDLETAFTEDKPGEIPKENCVILDTTKNPLKDDIQLLNQNNFIKLFDKSLGKANLRNESYGWSNFGDFQDGDTFDKALSVASTYPSKLSFFETCIQNRKDKEQKFIDVNGEKILSPGQIIYDMKLIETKEETNKLPDVLNKLFSNMENSLSDTNKEYNLLKSFGEYLNEDIDYSTKYDEIMGLKDNGVNVFDVTKLDNQDDEASKLHKMLFCFAWKHSGAEDEMEGGNPMISNNDAVVEGTSSQQSGKYKKYIVYAMCIVGYIYFAFVLFESYRLMIGSINRILDARAVYLEMNPGLNELDEQQGGANHNFLNYFYSFFTVLYQSGAGTLINVLSTYQHTAILKAKKLLNTVANTAGRTSFDRCQQGWFSCVNGYFTGSSQAEATTAATIIGQGEINIEFENAKTEIALSYNKILSDADFATKGFITGINGIVTCTILMGHMYNPNLYRIEHLTASYASLQSSYLASPIYGVFAIGTNLSILYAPNALKNAVPGESSDVPDLDVPIIPREPSGEIPPEVINEGQLQIDSVPNEDREAAEILRRLSMNKGGGKRKTGKRKVKRKTIKRKKKGKKTKRRKTIKRRNRKTKRRK